MRLTSLIPTTLAELTGWMVFWIVIAVLIVLLTLFAIYRFAPDFTRYMRIKRM
jgi:hypothetical protein